MRGYYVQDLTIENLPDIKKIPPRHVLIQIGAVGICGSDVHYYTRGRIGRHVVSAPIILGHEAAGWIAGRGPDVANKALPNRW